VGLGLTLQVGAGPAVNRPRENIEGTFGWLKMERELAERSVRQGFGGGGW
jgi:Fe-S cluster assembly ATPase SufC